MRTSVFLWPWEPQTLGIFSSRCEYIATVLYHVVLGILNHTVAFWKLYWILCAISIVSGRTEPSQWDLVARYSPPLVTSLLLLSCDPKVRNNEIGYCQSMNFVVATMLMYCSEEQSFWILCSLVEDVLPEGYYTETLSGLRAATRCS